MKTLQIPKASGRVRVVVVPEPEEKRRLRALVPTLNLLAEELDVYHVQHGFTEHRSPVTNAKAHIGWEYTVSFDLADCFDSITRDHAELLIKPKDLVFFRETLMSGCFVDGVARQGLPTSPALCNIALSPLDKEIVERFCLTGKRFGEPPAIYTRYADDLTISCRMEATVKLMLQEIPKMVERHGFRVNPDKTKVQCSKAGRRIITGISVGETDIRFSRELRRRLRAGAHQEKHGLKRRNIKRILFGSHRWKKHHSLRKRFHDSLSGLREWARLREPKEAVLNRTITQKVAAMGARIVNSATETIAKAAVRFKRTFG